MGRRQIVWRRVEVPIGRSAGPALADEPKEEQAEPRVGRPDWCGPEATPVQGWRAGPNRPGYGPAGGRFACQRVGGRRRDPDRTVSEPGEPLWQFWSAGPGL